MREHLGREPAGGGPPAGEGGDGPAAAGPERRGAEIRVVDASSLGIVFRDRRDAGERLAAALEELRGEDIVVLGVPRGGVEVAAVVARALGAPLDVVVPRKVGAPGNPELGIGAVAEGVEVIDETAVRFLGIPDSYLRAEIAVEQAEVARRAALYRRGRPPLEVAGRTAVVVDDGVATGGTAAASLRWARHHGARSVVLAVPVAPAAALPRLAAEADRIVALSTPEGFYAVGQWYVDFEQVGDDRVVELLGAAA